LSNKNPIVKHINNFNIDTINKTFDYMFVQSIFSHISEDFIDLCFSNIKKWLKPDGKFYSTFHDRGNINFGVLINGENQEKNFIELNILLKN
jgi:SAM-dependent methyltransferase